MSKIIGVTVGTPLSANKIKEKIKPVISVNGVAADENGDVKVSGGSDVYVGSGDMPEGYKVQIDPDGEGDTIEALIEAAFHEAMPTFVNEVLQALPVYAGEVESA